MELSQTHTGSYNLTAHHIHVGSGLRIRFPGLPPRKSSSESLGWDPQRLFFWQAPRVSWCKPPFQKHWPRSLKLVRNFTGWFKCFPKKKPFGLKRTVIIEAQRSNERARTGKWGRVMLERETWCRDSWRQRHSLPPRTQTSAWLALGPRWQVVHAGSSENQGRTPVWEQQDLELDHAYQPNKGRTCDWTHQPPSWYSCPTKWGGSRASQKVMGEPCLQITSQGGARAWQPPTWGQGARPGGPCLLNWDTKYNLAKAGGLWTRILVYDKSCFHWEIEGVVLGRGSLRSLQPWCLVVEISHLHDKVLGNLGAIPHVYSVR